MTPPTLSAALAALYGDHKGALADAGRALDVHPDSLRHMIAGRRSIPAGLAAEVARLVALRAIAPPPAALSPDADRDDPCADAIEPHLDDLLRRATDAGWHPAEVMAAVVGWAAHTAADHAGVDEARELLRLADEALMMRNEAEA